MEGDHTHASEQSKETSDNNIVTPVSTAPQVSSCGQRKSSADDASSDAPVEAGSAATPKIKWHIPTPKQVGQIKEALTRHNLSISSPEYDGSSTSPVKQPVPTADTSSTASISSSSAPVTANTVNAMVAASAAAAVHPTYHDSSSSSSSSDSSDDSSSDDEGMARARNPGQIVLNLGGAPLPRQLMMRCRVRLTRMTLAAIAKLVSSHSMQDYLSGSSASSVSLSNYPRIVNIVRESSARPFSKMKRNNNYSNAPLPKVKSARAVEQQKRQGGVPSGSLSRNCSVRLVDCWKGRPLPTYLNTWTESADDEVNSHSKRLKKKKKKKSAKLKQEVESEDEKPSRTKNKKYKPKSERRRIIMANSSDEEGTSHSLSRSKSLKRVADDTDLSRPSRQDKIKVLAEKKCKSSSDITPKEEAKTRESNKGSSSSFINPWSEAVVTAGLPKIPKIKKVAGGSYVPATQQQVDSNFRQVENPYERLQKREARRREFEKAAAMKYGGHGNHGQQGVQGPQGQQINARNSQVSLRVPTSQAVQTPHTGNIPHGVQAMQSISMPQGVPAPQGASASQSVSAQQGVQTPHGVPASHGVPATQGVSTPQGVSTSQGMMTPQGMSMPQGTIAPQGVQVAPANQVGPSNQLINQGQGNQGLMSGNLSHNYHLQNMIPTTNTISMDNPNYQIPRPPIPGQASANLDSSTARSTAPLLPVPPKDPRALLPSPDAVGPVPSPIIPCRSSGNALLPEPVAVLPDPGTLFAEPDSLMPDASLSDTAVGDGNSILNRCSPGMAPVKSQQALLPDPNSLLPSPSGLLPAPDSLLPRPADGFNGINQRSDRSYDKDQWTSALNSTGISNKLNPSEGNAEEEWGGSQAHSRHQHNNSVELSHQTMPADSTSADDIPANQEVFDEICRLSLEISKRIAKKTAIEEHSPAIIPLEPNEPAGPAEIPLEDDAGVVYYDYGHSRPPLPVDEKPRVSVLRGPTPPPNMPPPPPVPQSAASCQRKPLIEETNDQYYQPQDYYNQSEFHNVQENEIDTAEPDDHPISSRHFEEQQHTEESYEDILAIEQERTRKELYYEELRRSAQSANREHDRYEINERQKRYGSAETQDYSSSSSLHHYEERADYGRRDSSAGRDFDSNLDHHDRFKSSEYYQYSSSSSRSATESARMHDYDSKLSNHSRYAPRSNHDRWQSLEQRGYERTINYPRAGDNRSVPQYEDDEDPYYVDLRRRERARAEFEASANITKDRYGLPVVNTRPNY